MWIFFLIREKKKTYYGVECKIHTNFKAKTYDFENASGYSPDFSGGIVLKVIWKDGLVKGPFPTGSGSSRLIFILLRLCA